MAELPSYESLTGLPLPRDLYVAKDGSELPEAWKHIGYVRVDHGGTGKLQAFPLTGHIIARMFPAESQLRRGIRLYLGVKPLPGDLVPIRAQSVDPAFVKVLAVLGDEGLYEVDVTVAPDYA